MRGDGAAFRITDASGEGDIVIARELFSEYRDHLGVDLGFQDFSTELMELPGAYSPPSGRLLLAWFRGEPAGCVALKKAGEDVCEMKRLYVRPEFRGHGIGRVLAERVIEAAAGLGYVTMVLDTLDRLEGAMALYASLGFRRTAPYYDNPLPGVVYWKLELQAKRRHVCAGD
ncbi:MAG: GNAT family N-acetyltransferase [Candidatus Fermentibacteraceae bacterium]|nr:GNAT family N-acetyltransferase [Candidatus Fermentibacteraceae bacterium]